ncbi:hypothetical protein BH24ACT21_BH24ACT21_09700 [soil metagenome]|jgi:hypothetical protein
MTELIHKAAQKPKKRSKKKHSKYNSGVYSGYLYPDPDAWYGAASTLDLFGLLNDYNYSSTGREADAKGLQSDFYAVANDFWRAVWTFEREHPLDELPEQYRLFDPDETKRIS